jgi:hypothetical protein
VDGAVGVDPIDALHRLVEWFVAVVARIGEVDAAPTSYSAREDLRRFPSPESCLMYTGP